MDSASRVIERRNFTSVPDLRGKLLPVLDDLNRTPAKPCKRTFTGRPPNV